MKQVVTRQIEPSIEKYFKIATFSTLVFLTGISFLEGVVIVAFICLGIYELIIYKQNEEYINLFEQNKERLTYNILMKYYKVCIIIVILAIIRHVAELDIYPTGMLLTYSPPVYIRKSTIMIITYLTILGVFIYNAILEIFIINIKGNKKRTPLIFIIIKYIVVFLILNFSVTYYKWGYFRFIFYAPYLLIGVYSFIGLNLMYISKKLKVNYNFLNKSLIYDFIAVFGIQCAMYISLQSKWRPPFNHLIMSYIIIVIFLFIKIELQKKYFTTNKIYSKIINLYLLIILITYPIAYLDNTEYYFKVGSFVFSPMIGKAFIIGIFYLIIIFMFIYNKYVEKKKIKEIKIIQGTKDLYDNWI